MEIKLLSDVVISSSGTSLLKVLIKNRHIEDTSSFLNPPFPTLDIPLLDISKEQNILIYGDYDVDGITSTAILWQTLYKLGYRVTPFIPHREHDGYGFKAKSFFRFQTEKKQIFDVLITVDNGIVAQSEFTALKSAQNTKIIVIDHHVAADSLDVDQLFHNTNLSGAGLTYFVAGKLDSNVDIGLAALGTVADCLPLTGLNRSLVVHGIASLRTNPCPGIRKLISISGGSLDKLGVYDLGFVVGPRINAVGRLSDPTDALRLLCSRNQSEAEKYANSLNNYNQDRQFLQKESLDLAEQKVNSQDKVIVIDDPSFSPGIIGLIAGRLTEKHYLPSIIISSEGDIAKGSCRSIPELDIIDSLRAHRDIFLDLGGHPGAAGFSILKSNIPKLKELIIHSINKKLENINLKPHLNVDAKMDISAVNMNNIRIIEQLAPFGNGNPEPTFLFEDQLISSIKTLGQQNDHLKITFGYTNSIAFKMGHLINIYKIGDKISFVASLSANTWNGSTTPQLIIRDIV